VPKYFLDQIHKGDRIPDPEGEEFRDIQALKAKAIIAAREIMAERLLQGDELDHSRFEVKNQKGKIVLIMPFKDALPDGYAD
jgi:hypothetical protein